MGVRPSPRARDDRVRLVNGADVRRDRWTLSLQCLFAACSAARFGQDSGRSAPCVQPKTPDNGRTSAPPEMYLPECAP